MYEVTFVQPSASKWLRLNGYTPKSEVRLAQQGRKHKRPDFIATSWEGDIAIVECKGDCLAIDAAIDQILEYKTLYPAAHTLYLVVPRYTLTDYAAQRCKETGIILVGITIDFNQITPAVIANMRNSSAQDQLETKHYRAWQRKNAAGDE
jgi:hypothetical protein